MHDRKPHMTFVFPEYRKRLQFWMRDGVKTRELLSGTAPHTQGRSSSSELQRNKTEEQETKEIEILDDILPDQIMSILHFLNHDRRHNKHKRSTHIGGYAVSSLSANSFSRRRSSYLSSGGRRHTSRGADAITLSAAALDVGSDATLALARSAGVLAKASIILGRTTKKGAERAGRHVKKKIEAKLEVRLLACLVFCSFVRSFVRSKRGFYPPRDASFAVLVVLCFSFCISPLFLFLFFCLTLATCPSLASTLNQYMHACTDGWMDG